MKNLKRRDFVLFFVLKRVSKFQEIRRFYAAIETVK